MRMKPKKCHLADEETMMAMGLNMHYKVLSTPRKMEDLLPYLEFCRQPTPSCLIRLLWLTAWPRMAVQSGCRQRHSWLPNPVYLPL